MALTTDLEAIRTRARAQMTDGAVTKAHKADRERVLTVLNGCLATEIVSVLRYKSHYYMALREMVKKNVVAERIAIETYSEAARCLGDDDPTTRRLMESILGMEEEHANDLLDLLDRMEKSE